MITIRTPKKTSILVTLVRWVMCYGYLIAVFSIVDKNSVQVPDSLFLFLALPVAFFGYVLAVPGVNFVLSFSSWGRSYLKFQNEFVENQRLLRMRGERIDGVVVGDTGIFAAQFLVSIAGLLTLICLCGYIADHLKR